MMQASLGRIFDLFDTEPSVRDTSETTTNLPETFEIVFDKVTLAYGSLPVLNELSFTAAPGTTTALVGQSGAGKSTVFNVLTRLIDPQSGAVTLGSMKLPELPLEELRQLFSVGSQDALLFDETLRENILLGRSDVSDDVLQTVLNDAHVNDFLSALPNGLDTKVGARGSNLSGGQRQRVAIARALLRDTPILLLDEATSALDAESELLVQQALDRLAKGRTTLVIAHRLSTIRDADQILVMDKGSVAEQGKHNDLVEKGGIYAHLHDLQFQSNDRNQALNRPNTDILKKGTVAEMVEADHLIIHSHPKLYWQPRPLLRPRLSILLTKDALTHASKARNRANRFFRILTTNPQLAQDLPNAAPVDPEDLHPSAAKAVKDAIAF